MSTQPESKRRRVSSDGINNEIAQPAVMQHGPVNEAADSDPESELELELEEIPRVMLELQNDDSGYVFISALTHLTIAFLPRDWFLDGNWSKTTAQADAKRRQKDAMCLGVVSFLVVLLGKWKNYRGIVLKVLHCLELLLAVDDHVEEASTSIARLGGVDLIFSPCQKYPDHSRIQSMGLYVLSRVLLAGTDTVGPRERATDRFVGTLDGITVVVNNMKKYPDAYYLQTSACRLFGKCAQDEQYHDLLHRSGAASAAATAASVHLGKACVKKEAQYFLSKMFPEP